MSRLEIYRPARPGLLARIGETIRSYTLGPLSLKDPEIRKYFAGGTTGSGVSVSEHTALALSAVWAAVNLISLDVASLPLVLYRRQNGGKERYEGHPLYRILHDTPNPEMSSATFRSTLQAHALTWGNGYAEIEIDGAGRPRYLWPITPDRVTPYRDGGELYYRVLNGQDRPTILEPAQIVHIHGLGWDGNCGYSVIGKARESIGLGMAAEKFGATFYGNGSHMGGVVSRQTRWPSPTDRKNFLGALNDRHQGVDRAHKILLLDDGMTWTATGIPPNDAQFLETRQFQITEIARWFGVPPHKIGDLSRSTNNNIEQQALEYFQTTILHWVSIWEEELSLKLISPLERNQQEIEHVVDGFLRADSLGRSQLQTAEFGIAALTPNEARALSNRNPITGGDRGFVPLNFIPLDRVDEWITAQIAEKQAKATAAANPPAAPTDTTGRSDPMRDAYIAQLKEDLETAKRQIEEGKAEEAHVRELLDGAQNTLAEEKASHVRDIEVGYAALESQRKISESEKQRADDAEKALATAEAAAAQRESDAAAKVAEWQSTAERIQDSYSREAQMHYEAKQAAEAKAQTATQRADAAEQNHATAEAALAEAKAELDRQRTAQAERLAGLAVAHRGLVVDVMKRMIEREIDRATRHQATPQKFRAWVDTFYQTHVDAVADALVPIVRAHLALLSANNDPHEMARKLAEQHADESARQLRDLLHVEDFHPMLERTLQQWAESRPGVMADRLLTQGVQHVVR